MASGASRPATVQRYNTLPVLIYGSHCGLLAKMQIRHSKGLGFNPRTGQIAYFCGVKIRFSTLGTGDVPRGSYSA